STVSCPLRRMLFPSTTLFRSEGVVAAGIPGGGHLCVVHRHRQDDHGSRPITGACDHVHGVVASDRDGVRAAAKDLTVLALGPNDEERGAVRIDEELIGLVRVMV